MGLLLLAIPAGYLAGLVRSWINRSSYDVGELRYPWLALIAFLPQFFAFQLPATRSRLPDELAAVALVVSQLLLVFFAWENRQQPCFWLLGCGLLLNLTAIVLNGGLMPMSPETVARLIPELPPETWISGERFGHGKDILLAAGEARLWWLGDRFLLPAWFPYRAAYSIGDIFIAAGVFWLFWTAGRQRK